MPDYSIRELEKWNKQIEKVVREEGLDFYQQEFEIVDYEDMICYEAYTGMPSNYPHWSYGKAYEKIKTLNKYNLSGLPYEMVINSNPCVAYLMKDNSLLLQVLTMAHVYGHNDFFKNNRLFKDGTDADSTIQMFMNHAARVREYISDPSIGYSRVERVIDTAHALRYQTSRTIGEKLISEEEKKKIILQKYESPKGRSSILESEEEKKQSVLDLKKIPLEPEEDILLFVYKYGRLSEWEKDIINIVRKETLYFLPQIETKIMNEGWASYWHYKVLNKLKLPQGMHIEFLKRHNQVICPYTGNINPYYLGFKMFENIRKSYDDNPQKIFEVRQIERDESFIRRYLTYELCKELNLFEYVKVGRDYIVSEVADEEGWKKIRDTLAASSGMGNVPVIKVDELVQNENSLILFHEYDGRELELAYTKETLRHLTDLWQGKVLLKTFIDGKRKVLTCDDDSRVFILNG